MAEGVSSLTALAEQRDRLQAALDYAILVIASYERHIIKAHVGVDLVAAGFCQGPIFQEALDHIEELAG